jgi:cytochrome P450
MPGNIVYADAAGQPIIVLSDVDIANEILDKKGASCSERPVLNMAGELAGYKDWTVLLMYGPRLKESRKYMHRAIGTLESLRKFHALFEAEVRKYLNATLRDPNDIQQHIRRYLFTRFLLL